MATCPKCGRINIKFRKGVKTCPRCGILKIKEIKSDCEERGKD